MHYRRSFAETHASNSFMDALKNKEQDHIVWAKFRHYMMIFKMSYFGAYSDGRYFAECAKNEKWFAIFKKLGGVDMNTRCP